MSTIALRPVMATAAAEPRQPWSRSPNRYGLAIVVVGHIILLAAVLSMRSRAPTPPQPDLTVLPLYLPKPPQVVPAPPPKAKVQAAPSLPAPEPPPVIIEPKVDPVPPQLAPPVEAPVAPAPTVAAAPVAAAPTGAGAASTAPPAASSAASTKLFDECADTPDRKMVAEVYRLSPRATSVKEMDRRKPVSTVCMTQLNIAPRNMGLGLQDLDISEWFGLDIRFTIYVPQDGPRDFVLLSDDGAILIVDDQEVINNDGLHRPDAVMGTVNLTKGRHNVRVRYFQGPGDGSLMLGWKKPDAADFQPIPIRLLGRPQAAAPTN